MVYHRTSLGPGEPIQSHRELLSNLLSSYVLRIATEAFNDLTAIPAFRFPFTHQIYTTQEERRQREARVSPVGIEASFVARAVLRIPPAGLRSPRMAAQ